MNEPFSPPDAKKKIREIMGSGRVIFTSHARDEMAKDDIGEVDVGNTLRAGVVQPAEWESGAWRYRVATNRMFVVVEFIEELNLLVVTAWRLKR